MAGTRTGTNTIKRTSATGVGRPGRKASRYDLIGLAQGLCAPRIHECPRIQAEAVAGHTCMCLGSVAASVWPASVVRAPLMQHEDGKLRVVNERLGDPAEHTLTQRRASEASDHEQIRTELRDGSRQLHRCRV